MTLGLGPLSHFEPFARYLPAWLWVLGCSAAQNPPPATDVTALPTNQMAVAGAGPTAPLANVAPEIRAPLSTPTPASPLHVVGIGGTVIAADDSLYLYDGAELVAEVVGDTVENHPEYVGSYTMKSTMESVQYVGGKWPDRAHIAVTHPEQRSSYTVMLKKVGKQWKEVTRTRVAEWVTGVSPWDHGRRVALISAMYGYYRWEVVEGPPRSVPIPARAKVEPCCGPNSTALSPVDFAALPSGHLFALGALVEEQSVWGVERWAPNATRSQMDRLPLPDGDGLETEVTGLYAVNAEDIYAFGELRKRRSATSYLRDSAGGYLAHFDGKSWAQVPISEQAQIVALAADGEALWLAAGGKLFRRSSSGSQFEAVALPDVDDRLKAHFPVYDDKQRAETWRLSVTELLVRSHHDLWVTAHLHHGKIDHGPIILRNRPHAALWQGLRDKDYTQTMEQYKTLRPADEYCTSIFVLLYGMTRSTPKNYDYPLTRAALKGHTEFRDVVFAETEDVGKHYFGAFVPDYRLARELVKLVATKVPGTKPIALCRNPKQIRTLELDLATGNVLTNEPVSEAVPAR